MEKSAKFRLITCFGVFINVLYVSALLAIPTEDLLGPEVCPTGSFCIDSNQCIDSYYTTKFGHPFYCGPRYKIDSKICCIETEGIREPPFPRSDGLESNDIHFHSTNPSEGDDDEVEIVSVPFTTQANDDLSIQMPSDADPDLETPLTFDMQSLIEDAIEEELSSAQSASSRSNVRETGLGDGDALHNDFRPILNNHLNSEHHSNQNANPNQESFQGGSRPEEYNPHSGEKQQDPNLEFRKRQNNEGRSKAFTCPCDKGEKGDVGPKGEPGEPGKIIYIPVFMNTVSSGSSGTPVTGNLFSSPQQMHQQVPQHPNPTVVPFSVPVNIPTIPAQPVSQSATGAYAQQQHSLPHPTTNQPPPPITPTHVNPIPYTDSMEARLARNAQYYNDQRFVNSKRY